MTHPALDRIVAADIGGTHARFAVATMVDGGAISLGDVTTLRTREHADLASAWLAFAAAAGEPLPRKAAIGVASPIAGDVLTLTNSPWTIARSAIGDDLGLERFLLLNDFVAVGHAVAGAGPEHLRHVCGPDRPFPDDGVISIVGPGTGLGVAQLVRQPCGYKVIETEGGHIGFAPTDEFEDAIALRLRHRHRRVSVERVMSGPGLVEIYETLAVLRKRAPRFSDDKALWAAALESEDDLAREALDQFCGILGAVAGDIALAQGASGVVVAGGIGRRIEARLPGSSFAKRFAAKGRFETLMSEIVVKSLHYDNPGLLGAAIAFFGEEGANSA